jgi:hypothetical protein
MLSPNHLFSNSRAAEGAGSVSHWAEGGISLQSLLTHYL